MHRFFKTRFLQIFIICIYVFPAHAQNSLGEEQSLYNYVKEQYKTSDILVNGKELFPDDPRINNYPYLFTENWIAADIYIKGEVFYNELIRYNLYSDQLVLQFYQEQTLPKAIILDNQLVDSVDVNGHMLVSVFRLGFSDIDRSFVELIESGEMRYCIAYYKDYIRMYSTLDPYGKYSELKTNKYLFRNGKSFKANNRRQFLRAFPDSKREIRRFLRRNNMKYKNATTSQISTLIEFCNELD
ncbi:MAG TPA: hypothetical protein VJ937_05710 [Salinivirga sp.]|uniref:hypothetical protein n=1 Tax=Salinivirga sp. TaxID=1970192 RepID=UPI002B4A5BEE|nr:hypothetical protein [Salinivirga sp.]HKK58952.1 hypothetical protein [Salinivirga sp.]